MEAGGFAKAVADLNNAQVTQVAHDLDGLIAKSKEMLKDTSKKHDQNKEVAAAGRQDFLAQIDKVHAEVMNLDQVGVDPTKLATIKGRMFRTIQELSPYHSQGRNVDILENNAQVHKGGLTTRTCNVTSLSMALEGLGKNASGYASHCPDDGHAEVSSSSAQLDPNWLRCSEPGRHAETGRSNGESHLPHPWSRGRPGARRCMASAPTLVRSPCGDAWGEPPGR